MRRMNIDTVFKVRTQYRVGQLARIAIAIADAGGLLGEIEILSMEGEHTLRNIVVETADEEQTARVEAKLRKAFATSRKQIGEYFDGLRAARRRVEDRYRSLGKAMGETQRNLAALQRTRDSRQQQVARARPATPRWPKRARGWPRPKAACPPRRPAWTRPGRG